MTDRLRIAHLRIAPQWAILRWAILSPSVIRIAHPNYYIFLWIICAWYGPWVNTGDTASVFNHNILKNKLFRAIWGVIWKCTLEKSQINKTNGLPKIMHRSSSRAGHLRTRLKTRSEKKTRKMQPLWFCIQSGRQFEETFLKTQWRKVKQM